MRMLTGLFILAALLFTGASQAQQSNAAVTSKLNITTSTVVKAAPGVLLCFTVSVSGSQGTINDTTTTGAVAAGNQIGVIPATVGLYCGTFPFLSGLVVAPGASQVVSVSYQ